MQFEEMKINDYDSMIELWQNTPGMGITRADSREGIDSFLKHNPGLCFTCSELGRIVGTILCGFDGRRGYMYHLAVDKAYRSRGIGKKLVKICLDALANKGVERCQLFVYKNNELGKGFWKANGWILRDDIVAFSKDMEVRD